MGAAKPKKEGDMNTPALKKLGLALVVCGGFTSLAAAPAFAASATTYGTSSSTSPISCSTTTATTATSADNAACVPASETLTAGTLHLNSVGAVAFPGITLNGTDTSAATTSVIDLTDATGSGDGWNVTLAAPALSYVASSATYTLPECNLTSTSALSPDSGSDTAPGTFSQVSTPIGLASSAEVIASDTNGAGSNNFTASLSQPIPSSAVAGTYSATWTVTVTQAPATLATTAANPS